MVNKIIILIIATVLLIFIYIVNYVLKQKEGFVTIEENLIKNRDLKIMLISLPKDKWKRDRFKKTMITHKQFFNYKIWDGIILREKQHLLDWAIENKYTIEPKDPQKKGNIGSALAHITLWDEISKHDDNVYFLVFEDNVLATNKSWECIQKVKNLNYDFINMCVLRPKGNKTQIPNILAFDKKSVREPLPNVWLSSYLITPKGATLFLEELKKNQYDLSVNIIDRIVTRFLHSKDNNIKAYIFDNHNYFGHIETPNDTRRKENSGSR
jgi:GR25 family glycosyltransferase involved in LPS biosynthesis